MKEALVAYLLAVYLNFALLLLEFGATSANVYAPTAAVVRVFDGTRVAVGPRGQDGRPVWLAVGHYLRVSAVDPQQSLFPGTSRLERLETPVAVLN